MKTLIRRSVKWGRLDPDSKKLLSANPKGCKESSRWSESAETTGKVISHDRTPRESVGLLGSQRFKFDAERQDGRLRGKP